MKVCIATGTRAEWGLLSPVAAELKRRGISVQILATNMHLSQRYGHTIDDIKSDGYSIDGCVPLPEGDSRLDRAIAMGRCLEGTAKELDRLRPDIILILGDRYEMLAVASAAMMLGIPIAHMHGGEVTLGAIDDNIRHAITKLASLHLPATEEYRQRIIAMGEDPRRVINTGSIGVWNLCNEPGASEAELFQSTGIDMRRPTLLVTYHPATLDDVDPAIRCQAMLDALDRFPGYQIVITYPNNDPRSSGIIDRLEGYANSNPERVILVKSLGVRRYMTVLRHCAVVIGNSSSGILEAPSAGVPSVDIGSRQSGRIAAESVIHCGNSTEDIAKAISLALSPAIHEKARSVVNPYYRPDTLNRIADAIIDFANTSTAPAK